MPSFSLFLSLTSAALSMIPQSSSSSLYIPVLFTPAFSLRTPYSSIQLHELQDTLSSTFSWSLHPAFNTNSSPTSHYRPCSSQAPTPLLILQLLYPWCSCIGCLCPILYDDQFESISAVYNGEYACVSFSNITRHGDDH